MNRLEQVLHAAGAHVTKIDCMSTCPATRFCHKLVDDSIDGLVCSEVLSKWIAEDVPDEQK